MIEAMKFCRTCKQYYFTDACPAHPSKPAESDVRNQQHYAKWKIQPAEFIINNDMSYAQGCAIKYLTRYQDKGTPIQDLEKAKHYIDMLIMKIRDGEVKL